MAAFEVPADLAFNRGAIDDPDAFAREAGADAAPFAARDELRAFVTQGLEELRPAT